MARASERLTADAYTRASVEDYLRAVGEERTRLELAIAEQQRRRDSAARFLDRLDAVGPVPTTGPPGPPEHPAAASAPPPATRAHGPATASPSVPVGSGE